MHLSKCNIIFLSITYMLMISWSQQKVNIVLADDAPGVDLNALANIASNLANNPQIVGLVSSFLNQNGPKQSSTAPSSNNLMDTFSDSVNSDANTIVQQQQQSTPVPTTPQSQSQPQQQQDLFINTQIDNKQSTPMSSPNSSTFSSATNNQQVSPPDATTTSNANPLNNLISLLPNVLPSLSNLLIPGKQNANVQSQSNPISSIPSLLMGGSQNQQASSSAQTTTSASLLASSSPNTNNINSSNSPSNLSTHLSTGSQTPNNNNNNINSIPNLQKANTNGNSAQSVINQVLSAYLSGQIPNELLQLGLSGRVPPQVMELALSGQVPSKLIQMVITGQIPTSTINSFLATMQGNNHLSSQSSSTTDQKSPNNQSSPSFSLTKLIFETLFNRASGGNKESSNSIKVPTLLGPVALPNVRRLGQIVGGTITNVASIIPF